jgi:hypothetical protein
MAVDSASGGMNGGFEVLEIGGERHPDDACAGNSSGILSGAVEPDHLSGKMKPAAARAENNAATSRTMTAVIYVGEGSVQHLHGLVLVGAIGKQVPQSSVDDVEVMDGGVIGVGEEGLVLHDV